MTNMSFSIAKWHEATYRTVTKGGGPSYSAHPMIRDGVVASMSRSARDEGHQYMLTMCGDLIRYLDGAAFMQGEYILLENPLAVVDILEEYVHHSLCKNDVVSALANYRTGLG